MKQNNVFYECSTAQPCPALLNRRPKMQKRDATAPWNSIDAHYYAKKKNDVLLAVSCPETFISIQQTRSQTTYHMVMKKLFTNMSESKNMKRSPAQPAVDTSYVCTARIFFSAILRAGVARKALHLLSRPTCHLRTPLRLD